MALPGMKRISHLDAWTGTADCRNCAIRASVLFAGLEETDFESVHRPIDQLVHAAGAEIYHTGAEARSLLTIRSGLVKLTQYLPDGTQRIVRLQGATDILGLEALLASTYQHTATALQPTEVCRIPVETVRQLSERRPRLYHELMARWFRALSDADRSITELSTGNARARVARVLLMLAERSGGNRCQLFSREDLGAVLGLTTETASRAMAELKRQGFMTEPRANEFILDIDELRALAM